MNRNLVGLIVLVAIFTGAWFISEVAIGHVNAQPKATSYEKYYEGTCLQDWYGSTRENTGLSWADHVKNPENQEFLVEVLFNLYDDWCPNEIPETELQLAFIARYWDTCTPLTKFWYTAHLYIPEQEH